MMTGIFVDIAKNYHGAIVLNKRARVNYEKYLRTALGEDRLHRAYAYGVQLDNEANDFIIALKKIGFYPKYKSAKMVLDEDGTYRPNIRRTSWTVGMAMDVVRNIGFLDHVVLGFNDPDIIELIDWVKEKGVRVTVFSINIHRELKMAADSCKEITDDLLDLKESINEMPT